jgi:DNA-directed RNA polymerase subunit RPC12/RpoP
MVADSLDHTFRMHCSNCEQPCSVVASRIMAGETVECPNCQSPVIAPAATPAEVTGRAPIDHRKSELRPLAPTGRLKPVNFVGQAVHVSSVPQVELSSPPAPASLPAIEPHTLIQEPIEEIRSAKYVESMEFQSNDATSASKPDQGEESDESSRPRRSRRRRSSSGRSSSELSWNDIGVDGLPIRRSNTVESESDAVEAEVEGTRLRDVTGLVLAVGLSLVLTQAGLWWGAGVDPLGLWPYVSGWFPNLAPTTFAQ